MKHKTIYPRFKFRKKIALKMLGEHINNISNFLEIGAGSGDFSVELSNKIKKGVLLDFSESAVRRLKKKYNKKNIKIINGDFLNIDFREKYGLILMFDVLEHIKNDDEVLKKINDLLDGGGVFIFSVPSRMKKWSVSDEIVGHYRRYEKKDLIKKLQDNNFEILKFYSYGFPILNIVSFFSNLLFEMNLGKIINSKKNKKELSRNSGLGYVDQFRFKRVLIFLINFLFSDILLGIYIFISRPFNGFDMGDGYLCLVRKVDVKFACNN